MRLKPMPTFDQNIEIIRQLFTHLTDQQKIYLKIIECGQSLCPLSPELCTESNRVKGCQSTSYIYGYMKDSQMLYQGRSDALISKGLMQLMIMAYSGLSPETILHSPPSFLEEFKILSSISLTRINGLNSLYLLMKQQALSQLVNLNNKD